MKKLMIAATAAMAGATVFGGLCDPEAVSDSCSVYNIKFTFKTLNPKTACAQGAKWLVTDTLPGTPGIASVWYRNSTADKDASDIAKAASRSVEAADYVATGDDVCNRAAGDPDFAAIKNAAERQVFWMDNATRKFEGIAWQCRSACFEGTLDDCDPNNNGRLNYVIWEKKNSLAISFPVFQAKIGPDDGTKLTEVTQTVYFSLDAQRSMYTGRYGKKAQKVAAYWDLTGRLLHAQSIDAAGFGTYDVKNLRTKSISGNAVGLLMPVDNNTDPCGNKDRIFCALGFMCVAWKDWCCDGCYAGVELVPASGTWSLKYNSSATKKANKDKATLADFVPAYMFYSNAAWADARAADPLLHTDNYYYWGTTANTFLYKDGGAAGDYTTDDVLDFFAQGACNVINVVFDGVYESKEGTKKYTYYGEDYTLEDSGALPEAVFVNDLNPAPGKE